MAKNKVVTSSMAVALTVCSINSSFAEKPNDTNPPTDMESSKIEKTVSDKKDISEDVVEEPSNTDDSGVSSKDENKPTDEVKPPKEDSDWLDWDVDEDTKTINNAKAEVKDGFYIKVAFGNEANEKGALHKIPTATFELLDDNGKVISTAIVNKDNYIVGEGYLVGFKGVPAFKYNSKFTIRLKSADREVKHILVHTINSEDEEAKIEDKKLERGKNVSVNVGADIGSVQKDGYNILEVEGSKNAPLNVTMVTDSNLVVVQVVDAQGNPKKNTKFEIERTLDKSKLNATTDSNGYMYLDRVKVEPVFRITSLDKDYEFENWGGREEVKLPIKSVEDTPYEFLSKKVTIKKIDKHNDENNEVSKGKINTTMKVNGNSDLSNGWLDVELELKNNETGAILNYSLNQNTKELPNVADGKYTITAKSKYAKVVSDKSVNVKNGVGNLNVEVSPNHILEITKRKDGKSVNHNFSVINKEGLTDKKYTGSDAKRFGVIPGETFMVQDNDTNEIFTVTIGDKVGTTKLILGEGVILSADGTAPHTRDMEGLYVGLLGASVIAVGVLAFRTSKDKKKAMKTLTMMLVMGGMFLSYVPSVFADTTGGNGTTTGGSGGQGGGLNTHNGKDANITKKDGEILQQVIQFGFVPTYHLLPNGEKYAGMSLKENATEEDLASAYKFNSKTILPYVLYMPINNATSKDFKASGVLDYHGEGYAKRFYLTQGYNRLYGKIHDAGVKVRSQGEMQSRVTPIPSVSRNSSNKLLNLMGRTLLNAETKGQGVYLTEYGNTLSKNINALDENAKDKLFYDYIDYLKSCDKTAGVYKESRYDYLIEEYEKGAVTFVAQTLTRIHKGSDKGNGMYASIHSLARALGTGDNVSNHVYTRERRYFTNNRSYCIAGPARGCKVSGCMYNSHLGYGSWRYLRDGYSSTIRALSDKVKNPEIFGGWGFFHWKDPKEVGSTANPELSVTAKIDLIDESGAKVGEKVVPVTDLTGVGLSKIAREYKDYQGAFLLSQGTIVEGGKKYELVKEDGNTATFKDTKDNESLFKDKLQVGVKGEPSKKVNVSMKGDGSPAYIYIGDILNPNTPGDLNKYLGADTSNVGSMNGSDVDDAYGDVSDLSTSIDNKYEGKKDDKGNNVFGNAEAVIHLKAQQIVETVKSTYEVPQWRLSRFWNDVAEKSANGTYTMTMGSSNTNHVTSTLSPNGGVTMRLKPVDVSKAPWLKTTPKWIGNNIATVSHGGSAFSSKIGGTLLATRTSKDVDTINFANWKGAGYTSEINSKDKGDTNYKYKDRVSKVSLLEYYMEDQRSYTHRRGVYKHYNEWVSTGKNGEGYNRDVCACYTTSETPTKTYTPAKYEKTMIYHRYHPKSVATVKYAGGKGLEEAFSWETKPTTPLKVYPEITMANSDVSGNNNVSIVAGDLDREVNPLSYHFLQLDAEVGSKVVGTSVATDSKAQNLTNQLVNSSGATLVEGGGQVIQKGSATNTSFTLKGTPKGIKQDKATLTAKTFAVDIGNTALKNSWNRGTTYNTDKLNNDYLSKFGTKDGANWKFTATFQPSLKVGTNDYKGKLEKQSIIGKPQATKEYTLTVRSGKLTLVSNKGVETLTPELKTALNRMKIIGSDKSVLDVFEHSQGAKLNEANVAKLINAIRGTDNVKVGQGWYHEDTTVLVVREYATIFDLPNAYMYADKIPMQVNGIDSPMDKNQFYTKGLAGHTTLEIGIDKSDVKLKYDSSLGKWTKGNKKEMQYVVPNVSILDTTK